MGFPSRQKKCKACSVKFLPERSLQEACSVTCAISLANHKQKVKAKKFNKKQKKDYLDNNLPHQLKITQTVFNTFIRALDEGLPCISCGRSKCGSFWDSGHHLSVGAHPELRFSPQNAHRQGSGCNRSQSRFKANEGAIRQKYSDNLVVRYNQDLVDWLYSYHPPAKYTCDDLRKIRKLFAKETKSLESGLPTSRNWRSLDYDLKNYIM